MEKTLKLKPPTMPNFAQFENPIKRKRQDGIVLNIKDFTKEEAIEYGELMKQAFIKHWESKQM